LPVAEHLSIHRFVTVDTSTGGAYALAVAALAPERILGVVACCSMTDMRWQPALATMSRPHAHAVSDAPDRESACARAQLLAPRPLAKSAPPSHSRECRGHAIPPLASTGARVRNGIRIRVATLRVR
jgi:pimeloyl-ACP methyl ester carboxylesterase